MSFSGCSPTISPGDFEPSANVSSIAVAPSTTWRLVRMSPARLTTTPLPRPSSSSSVVSGSVSPWVWMSTSDGWTRW